MTDGVVNVAPRGTAGTRRRTRLRWAEQSPSTEEDHHRGETTLSSSAALRPENPRRCSEREILIKKCGVN